jgi:hypothetical protein
MTNTQFVFKGKGSEYWRAQAQPHVHDFESAIRWVMQSQGLSKGHAILFARRLYPAKYNEWMRLRQSGRRITQRSASGEPDVMHMRSRTGQPLVRFHGL